MILADKIIRERKKLGLSQEELAEKMNISRQSVSKWESNQSLPEIDKILLMSSIFGVTTDYLLKDEIETDDNSIKTDSSNERTDTENENNSYIVLEKGGKTLKISSGNTKENTPHNIRTVTMEDAVSFLSQRKAASVKIAAGTFLCILSVIPLFILAAVSEYKIADISENSAGGFGLALLLIIIAAAVALFVYTGSKNAPYEFLEKEPFETENGVTEMVAERKKAFNGKYTMYNILGTVFCILSPIPLFMSSVSENGFAETLCLCITLMIAGIGAFFFIMAGVPYESMQKLLKEGEYSEKAKKTNSVKGIVSAIYWLVVTAAYLLMLFLPGDQGNGWKHGYSWIIWPVAGVLFPVALMICDIVQRKRSGN